MSQLTAGRSEALVPDSRAHRRIRRTAAVGARSLLYCALLLPLAIGAGALVLAGRAATTVAWWRWLRARVLGAEPSRVWRRPGLPMVIGHAVLSLLLGAAALVPLGAEALFLLRAVLYGLVDRGPYTDSWGGPTAAGAWAAHFLVGVPIAVAGLLALWGIAAVHQRLTLVLDGEQRSRWLLPVALVISLAGGLVFVAWLQQLSTQ